MNHENPHQLSFDAEFSSSEPNIHELTEQESIKPRLVGYQSDTGEAELPQSSGEADELRVRAQEFAKKLGGHADDYDWRCQ